MPLALPAAIATVHKNLSPPSRVQVVPHAPLFFIWSTIQSLPLLTRSLVRYQSPRFSAPCAHNKMANDRRLVCSRLSVRSAQAQDLEQPQAGRSLLRLAGTAAAAAAAAAAVQHCCAAARHTAAVLLYIPPQHQQLQQSSVAIALEPPRAHGAAAARHMLTCCIQNHTATPKCCRWTCCGCCCHNAAHSLPAVCTGSTKLLSSGLTAHAAAPNSHRRLPDRCPHACSNAPPATAPCTRSKRSKCHPPAARRRHRRRRPHLDEGVMLAVDVGEDAVLVLQAAERGALARRGAEGAQAEGCRGCRVGWSLRGASPGPGAHSRSPIGPQAAILTRSTGAGPGLWPAATQLKPFWPLRPNPASDWLAAGRR